MRKTWEQYFIELARHVSTRSTCNRKNVGCVIVKDNNILATGYNGSLSKDEHCDETNHLIVDGHCIRTIHAERNAIFQAAKNGVCLKDAIAYVNVEPCWECFKSLISSGIINIYYESDYPNSNNVYIKEYLSKNKNITFKKIGD
jgi:dCMP deaminase